MRLLVSELCKRFGGREVLQGVSLSCARGERVALLGANGTGKSTLLRIIAGVIEPEAGTVLLDGASLLGKVPAPRARLGYVPEAADPPPHLTTAELLALVAALKRAPPLGDAVLDRVGARALIDQPIGSLSLGQRRRACLAAALVGEPTLLVLDEPTNGLDPGGVEMLAGLIRDRAGSGTTTLVATHDLDFADAIGARRVALDAGRVAASPPASGP